MNQKPINLMSVCYNDRALGDLSALQNIKVKVERDKRYTFGEIVSFYNKKHNLPKTVKLPSGREMLNKHSINASNTKVMQRALKRFLANPQEAELKYQVAFTENKTYRSLWL